MDFACFEVCDSNRQVAPFIVSLSSFELIFLSSFFLPPSNDFILQKTMIMKSLFLKIRNCWVELSPAELLPRPPLCVAVASCRFPGLRTEHLAA